MDVTNGVCRSCDRAIDANARICPFCGADPETGEKPDTQALMQEVFRPREMTAADSVMQYARHRQGIVVTAGIVAVFLLLTGLHQFVTWRNAREVTAAPPVPLTEVTDLNGTASDKPPQMPELQFQFDGHPQRMQTLIVEQGAITPPEVIAAQQAAAQEEAARKAAAAPAPAQPGQRPQSLPGNPAAVPRPLLPAGQPAPATRPAPPPSPRR